MKLLLIKILPGFVLRILVSLSSSFKRKLEQDYFFFKTLRKLGLETKITDRAKPIYFEAVYQYEQNYGTEKAKLFHVDNPYESFSNYYNNGQDWSFRTKVEDILHTSIQLRTLKNENINVDIEINKFIGIYEKVQSVVASQSNLNLLKNQDEIIKLIKALNGSKHAVIHKKEALKNPHFFIGTVSIDKSKEYISRLIKEANKPSKETDFLFVSENSITEIILSEAVIKSDKINFILKGQPGIGKSYELQRLAIDLWEDHNNNLIPFYRSLRNFSKGKSLKEFLNWEELSKYSDIILILDGIDEIDDENYFFSEFNTFISNNAGTVKKSVLSIRSSIYENYKHEIFEPQVYELRNLDVNQAQKLLKIRTGHQFELLEIHNFKAKSTFLNDPYKLNIVAEFYLKERRLEKNPVDLWENYLKSILKYDEKVKFKKKNFDYWELNNDLRRVALQLELIKELKIDEDSLRIILNQERKRFEVFISCAIILQKRNNFEYEHKQLQEYLAAKLISLFPKEKIIKILNVNGANAVKPSLENTLTMLLDILSNDKEKQQAIAEWVYGNKPDLLFRADKDRLQSFQVPVFQYFFNNSIKCSKLWLRNTTSVSEEEIAQFADCPENFDYLMGIINDEEEHFRTRTTALSILAHFEPRPASKNELFQLLKPNVDKAHININSGIIDVFKHWRLITHEPEIISDVIEVFEDDDHSEPASRILSLILTDLEHLDKYMSFIEREMKFEFEREKRQNDDGVIRGNRWKLERMLTEIQNDDVFLNYLGLFLNQSKFENYNSEQFEKDIIKRLNAIKETTEKKLIDFFTNYFQNHKPDYFNHRKPTYRIVKELGLAKSLFERLFKPEFFKDNYGICAHLIYIAPTALDIFKDRIDNFKTLDQQLEYFRNIINSYNERQLALSIEKVLEENGFILNDRISDYKAFDELKQVFNEIIQKETGLMFDKTELYQLCEEHFKKIEKNEVCKKDFYLTKRDFKNNSQLVNTFGYETLAERIIFKAYIYHNKDCVNLKDCQDYLNDETAHFDFVFNEIQSHKGNTHLNIDFNIVKRELQDLIDAIIPSINTENLISFSADGSFSLNQDYRSFLMIQNIHQLLIDETLDVKVSDEFILNTLAYFDFKNFDNDTSKFEKLTDKVTDRDKLKKKIIANLQTELVSSVYTKHALFAINQSYLEAFKDIEAHLLKDKDIYSGDALLKPFVEKNGPNILKKMSDDLHTRACWTAIEMLFKDGTDKEFCINNAKEYLKTQDEKYLKYAAKVLFETNENAIIDYILDDVENRIKVIYSLNNTNYQNYSVLPSIGLNGIESLFNVIYTDTEFDKFDFSYATNFFTNYTINLVKHGQKFQELKNLFEKMRGIVEEEASDRRVFFVNSLLQDIEKAYINSLSKAMEFDEALKLVKELA